MDVSAVDQIHSPKLLKLRTLSHALRPLRRLQYNAHQRPLIVVVELATRAGPWRCGKVRD